MTLLLDSSHTH